jgi:hypothetical protein
VVAYRKLKVLPLAAAASHRDLGKAE